MNKYGIYDVGDLVIPNNGNHKDNLCEITDIDGAYIYIRPINMSIDCILEVYMNEIHLCEKYYEKRERKINEILK